MSSPPDDINFVHSLLETVWKSAPNISEPDQIRFETALIELASNVIQHADSGSGVSCTLTIETFTNRIEAVLRDTGEPGNVQLEGRTMPKDHAESGRGIPLIQALVDEFSYEREGNLNIWRITHRLNHAADKGAAVTFQSEQVHESQTKRFRLLRYFTVASLGMLVTVALALTYFLAQQGNSFLKHDQEDKENFMKVHESLTKRQDAATRRNLLVIHEAGATNLARLLESTLWDAHFNSFMASAQTIPVAPCRAMADVKDEKTGEMKPTSEKEACFSELGKKFMRIPGFAHINAKAFVAMKKSTLLKIKAFDLRGITLYSSEHNQIGQDKASSVGWIQAAMEGKPLSELIYRDKFSAFHGVVENRDLISIYLPVLQPGSNRIMGVFEVYSDATPLMEQIKQTSVDIKKSFEVSMAVAKQDDVARQADIKKLGNQTLIIVLLLMLLLFGALFLIVRRADGIITKQENEVKKAAQNTRNSEDILATIINTAPDGVVQMNSAGIITRWNAQAEKIFGWPRVEAIGRMLYETIIPPSHREAHTRGIKHFLATGEGPVLNKRIEIIGLHRDGYEFPIELSITPLKVAGKYEFNAFIRDITKEKEAFQNARNLASIIESSTDAITSRLMDGTFISWNSAAERMFGYLAEEIIGQPFSPLLAPENAHEDADNLSNVRSGNKIEPYETLRIRKDGSTIAISLTISPIYDDNGVVIGSSAIARDITEQKQASQSARNMASIIESSSDAITSGSLEGIFTSWNAGAERMYGYLAEEMIGQPFSPLLAPENAHEDADNLSNVRSGNKIEPYETLRIRKDGSTVAISLTISPIYDGNGVVIGSSAIARDITEQKQASQNARNLASIIESSNDSIMSVSLEGIVTSWNSASEHMTGYLAKEIIGQPVSLLMAPEKTRADTDNRNKILDGKRIEAYETLRIRKDGSAIPISLTVSPILDENGVVIGASGIARDLTEERQASQNARNLASIIESSNDAIAGSNIEGILTSWNPASERMFGYSAEEMIGQPFTCLIPSEKPDELADILSKIQMEGSSEPFETIRIRKDGSIFPISLTVSPIYDGNGVVIGSSGIARDLTQEKQIARNLIEINLANHQLEEIDRKIVAEDLDRAREVQHGLLPKELVTLPGFEVAGASLPAQAVGGDFYDWEQLLGGAAFTLADVMGKGVGSAIIAATVRAVLRAESKNDRLDVALRETAVIVNEDLEAAGAFVTLFHARLTSETGVLRYIDAGHGLAIIVRADGRTDRLFSANLPLGSGIDEPWQEQSVTLDLGDTLVVVSDGVLDLFDGTLASLDEVAKVARTSVSAHAIVDTIIAIATGATAPDDVTLLVVRRSE